MTKTINNLPVYKAVIDNSDESGIYCVSLVDNPAIESDFIAFSKEPVKVMFKVENEEKRIVRGCVMRADHPIYRIGNSGFEYYIIYEKQTIRQMVEKFLSNSNHLNIDQMHDFEMVEGVNLVQSFIKDIENGINPKGFEEIEDGSLFHEYHVVNDEIWDKVKAGEFKGFSLAGMFSVEELEDPEEQEYNEVMDLIEKINKRINKR